MGGILKLRMTAINIILFNLGWFASAYGVISGHVWLGPAVVSGGLSIHFLFVRRSTCEFAYILLGGITGYLVDTGLFWAGILAFRPFENAYIPPLWMLFVWFNFMTLFGVSLLWLRERVLLSSVFGAVGGPLTYGWADQLGVLNIGSPAVVSLFVLAVVWAFVVPVSLAVRFSKWFQPNTSIQSGLTYESN